MTQVYDKVALIGLGLIAGSMAHAMREGGLAGRITGFARSARTRDTAREIALCEVCDSAAEAVAGADLVVLSACDTGLGKIVSGEGLLGITRALLYAGAASVVVSLWQVADFSTSQMMISFYRHLGEAGDTAEALRRSKLEMIRQGSFAHPYYWAPFILIGRPGSGSHPVTSSSPARP